MTCAECGYRTKTAREYHPEAFCRMVKAGLDPWAVIRNAVVADMELSGVKPLLRAVAGVPRKGRVMVATADGSRGMQRGVRA